MRASWGQHENTTACTAGTRFYQGANLNRIRFAVRPSHAINYSVPHAGVESSDYSPIGKVDGFDAGLALGQFGENAGS